MLFFIFWSIAARIISENTLLQQQRFLEHIHFHVFGSARNKSQDNEAALFKEPNKVSEKELRDQQTNKNPKTNKILNEHVFNN